MARFLKHIPCPNCGSKDNRGVWDDGSEYCFGCRDYSLPERKEIVNKFLDKSKKGDLKAKIRLPDDAQTYLPEKVNSWLQKYNLTKEELRVLNPLYSYDRDLLIFPVYGPDSLLMYQGRYFGDNPKHPKYLTYGAKDVLHILGSDPETIVVTEDLISAVKVSTVTSALPLWGSSIPLGLARRLSDRFKRLGIWLDMDKAKESLKMRSELLPLFEEVKSIITPLDPKEYNYDEIRGFIG